MRKLFMLMVAALALTTWSFAQDQDNSAKTPDQDNPAKQDVQSAGHHIGKAAKATGRAVKKGAVATKEGAVTTKDKVAGRDDDKDRDRTPQSDRDAERDRDAARNTSSNTSTSREEALERSVHITNGPNVNPSSRSASIQWNTNKEAATDVWLMGGGIRGHRVQYDRGGSRDHNVTFSNLKPHTTYTYEIRTREGGDRKQGTFTTR